MPEEQSQSTQLNPATDGSPALDLASTRSASDLKTIELPVLDGDVIQLRITIDFRRHPRRPGSNQIQTRGEDPGSLDDKEAGGRSHPSRRQAAGS